MVSTTLDHEIAAISHSKPMRDLLARINGELDVMVRETDAAVVDELPELVDRADAAVRYRVIEMTFQRVLRRLAGHTGPDPHAEVHRAFGAAAAYAGVPLERLAAGYRIGARIGWAHIRQAVRASGLAGDLALLLADAQIAVVDELTSDSLEGYTQAMQTAHDRHARERQSLIDALLAGQATEEAARRVGWTWPSELAVAVLPGDSDPAPAADVLVGIADSAFTAIGPPQTLDVALQHTRWAAVGPTVPTVQAQLSFQRARQLANLIATGVLSAEGVVHWHDELPTLIVHSAPDATAELATRRLGPLRDPSAQRTRMLRETLAAWLDHPGQPHAIGQLLHLHPQTVRYRLARLRERLGDALDDPRARFEFALALHYQDRGGHGRRSKNN